MLERITTAEDILFKVQYLVNYIHHVLQLLLWGRPAKAGHNLFQNQKVADIFSSLLEIVNYYIIRKFKNKNLSLREMWICETKRRIVSKTRILDSTIKTLCIRTNNFRKSQNYVWLNKNCRLFLQKARFWRNLFSSKLGQFPLCSIMVKIPILTYRLNIFKY